MRAEPIEPNAEPSLDEILASIRRIINEEAPAMVEAEADVLVLTRRAPDPEAETTAPAAPQTLADAPEAGASATAAPVYDTPTAAASAAPTFEETPLMPEPTPEPALSDDARQAAAADLDRLHQIARGNDVPRPPSPALPEPGRTLEDLVREMMQPMIKAWIEENLPEMVRERVDEEIERIVRARVR